MKRLSLSILSAATLSSCVPSRAYSFIAGTAPSSSFRSEIGYHTFRSMTKGQKSTGEKSHSPACSPNAASEGEGNEPWYRVFVKSGDKKYERYMEDEWGHETHGDSKLFEMLTLEGAQAGLSWATILDKRENYREAFSKWDIEKIAKYGDKEVERLLADPGIVRHRGKITSTIGNARAALEIQKEYGSLDAFLWDLGTGPGRAPILTTWTGNKSDITCESSASKAMCAALKARGMKFVGGKICYAFMQATGMVIDHPVGTPQWEAARRRLLLRDGGAPGGKKRHLGPDSGEQSGESSRKKR